MRKNKCLFIFIILLSVVLVGVFFSCKKVPASTGDVDGDVIGVSTAMGTVYSALLAADGSVGQTVYFLSTEGSYKSGEKTYDVSLAAEIDVTQENVGNDMRSRLSLEVKSGTAEVLALYYNAGTLYINCMPYVNRGKISDFRLAERFAELHREKNNGVLKSAVELIPEAASAIFSGCKYYYKAETKAARYVFTISYADLFSSLSELIDDNADVLGITSAEFMAALHVTDAVAEALAADEAGATVEFALSDGVFVSAKAESTNKSFEIKRFTLSRDAVAVSLSSAISTFKEFDARNLYVKNGKAQLAFEWEEDNVNLKNYGVAANVLFTELTYPFDYTLITHYVAGSGLEGSLEIKDKNEKTTSFILKDGYLYVDLSAYGFAKCKIARTEIERRISALGMSGDGYTFRDKLRAAALLVAGITKDGDNVTCSFGREFFDLLSDKIGFRGLFGIEGGTLSWSVRDNTLSGVSVSLSVLGATLNLTNEYEAFSFGTPPTAEVTLPADAASYVDLATNETTHVSFAGTVQTSFSNAGAVLSSLLSSFSGESLTFSAESSLLNYTADLSYGKTGALDRALVAFKSGRTEIVQVYYTSEDEGYFYLILPPAGNALVRSVRRLTIAGEPFAAFNAAMGLSRTEQASKIYLSDSADSFMFGANATFASDALAALLGVHSGLSCRWVDEMAFRSFEVRLFADKKEGKLIFDTGRSIVVTAASFSVKQNDPFDIVTIEQENTATSVSLFANNAMPTYANVSFTGNSSLPTLKVSLDGLWTYSDKEVPKTASSGTQATVHASATLLAKTITRTLTADCTPPTGATLAIVSDETSVYDANTRTFTFARYGNKKVSEVFAKFSTITLSGQNAPKAIASWAGLPSAVGDTAKTFDVQPKVRTYFGDEVPVGVTFKLQITGDKVTKSNEIVTFTAYDGRDPFDPTAYPTTIEALTDADAPVTVTVGKWNPAVVSVINDYEGQLYACSEDDTVQATAYDCFGGSDTFAVTIRLLPKELPAKTAIDFDMTGRVGATYDRDTQKFVFDVLYVRSLPLTAWDSVLPSKLLKVTKNDKNQEVSELYFSGINWSFTEVKDVMNTEGKTGTLTLRVGDSVSGFQTMQFNYEFTAINVTGTALLDEAGETIATSSDTDPYTYAFSDVNVFTYRYPKYIKVFYYEADEEVAAGEEDQGEEDTGEEDTGEEDPAPEKTPLTQILLANWTFDKTFAESTIVNGGTYVGTSRVGSEPITVTYTFDKVHVYGYDFADEEGKIAIPAYTAEDGTEVSGGDLSYKLNNEEKRLIFSVGDTMGNVLRYYDEAAYPSVIRLYFSDDHTKYADVSVDSWDLSSYKKKSDIVKQGFLSDDTTAPIVAIVRGQRIKVGVFVEPLKGLSDSVYTSEDGGVAETVTFRLLTPDGNGGYTVNDPRKAASYPTTLYVKKNDGTLKASIPVLRWEDIDAFTSLFETELKKGTPVQNISGRYPCKAYYGDDKVGEGYEEIEVILEATVLEGLDVAGIPAAVSSEYAATEDGAAIKRIAGSGTRVGSKETFEYAFSLEMNPYYVAPDSAKSYPRYITFELNGTPVRATAAWDLTKVDPLATKLGNNYKYNEKDDPVGYPVYAELDLGKDLPNIKIGVEVNIKSREIAYVWIDGSSQPYIYVDGYADEPFGDRVVGNHAYIMVDVQFKGDLHRYPLYLYYDITGIDLSYDGSGYKDETTDKDFRVYVGNESGGYQPIAGYSVRVIAKRATKIEVVTGSSEPPVFYKRTTKSDGTFKEEFNHVDDLITTDGVTGEDKLRDTLEITFMGGSSSVTVHEYKSADKKEGLVFEWIRDEGGQLGVRLWNSNVAEAIRGADQKIYNREHTKDQSDVTATLLFKVDSYEAVYGDTVDTYLTPKKVLETLFASNFKTTAVEEKYQTRFILNKEETDPKKQLVSEDATLHAGEYEICVTVSGHGLYAGTASIPFTVTRKNIEDEVVVLVDGAEKESAFTKGLDYDKTRGYSITATSGSYSVAVLMYVNGEESVLLRDVNYRKEAPYDVIAYTIVVRSAKKDYSVGEGNVGKEYSITLHEIGLKKDEIVVSDGVWNALNSDFDFTVYNAVGVEELERFYTTENLTHGYAVTYYIDEDREVELSSDNVEPWQKVLTSGHTYYYNITVKIENYSKDLRTGSVTVPDDQ